MIRPREAFLKPSRTLQRGGVAGRRVLSVATAPRLSLNLERRALASQRQPAQLELGQHIGTKREVATGDGSTENLRACSRSA